jgi:PRTRC genetic system protein A
MMIDYLTDRRDQIVFGETPTLMQPLHGEALPKPEIGKHRFVIAGDGVYVEAINSVLEVRLSVAKSAIKLPYGQIGAVGVRLVHGQIPKRILQDVCEKTFLCAPNEWAGLVVWDKIRKEYAFYEPDVISFRAFSDRINSNFRALASSKGFCRRDNPDAESLFDGFTETGD